MYITKDVVERTHQDVTSKCAHWGAVHVSGHKQVKKQLMLCIYVVYVHNTRLKTLSYVYDVVIYIIQDITGTTNEDSRPCIVPLVLPTQLEREDSDSDCEDKSKDDTRQDEDLKPAAYDEDVDRVKSQDKFKGNKNKNDEEPVEVSEHYATDLIFYLTHDKLSSTLFYVGSRLEGEQQSSYELFKREH